MNSMMFMREDGQMGTCRICGKNFGLMGGYMEEFTGERLNVCVDCIKKFRQISEEDSSRVISLHPFIYVRVYLLLIHPLIIIVTVHLICI